MSDADASVSAADFTQAQSLVGRGCAAFHEIAPAAQAAPRPPAFMLGDVPRDLIAECWGPGFEWVHPQGVLEIEADLHFPYLLTRDDVPLDFTWGNMHAAHIATLWHEKPNVTPQPADRFVLLAAQGHAIFGHWLADFLPKLWLLDAAGFDLSALRYIVPSDTPAWAIELLRLCGITPEQAVTVGPPDVLRGTFLIPTTVHNGVRGPCFAPAADFLRHRLRIDPPRGGAKLFLARPGKDRRAATNRHEVERAAYASGYSVIQPERLSLLEQFRLVANADAVAGEYGSAMHSTLFAGPRLRVCVVRGTGLHPGFIQSAIGEALGQPTGYVFCEHAEGDAPEGFTVPLEDLRTALRNY